MLMSWNWFQEPYSKKTQTKQTSLNSFISLFIVRVVSPQSIPSPFQIHTLIHSLVLVFRVFWIPSLVKMAARVLTVAQDGSGNFSTVQQAIDAVPLGNTCRTVIRVAPGVYRQPVYVPKTKNFITLVGLIPENTVLTWNNTATKIEHHQVHPLPFRHN